MKVLPLFLLVSVLVFLLTSSVNGVPSESLVLYLTFDGTKGDMVYEAGAGLRFFVNGELDGEVEITDYGSIDNDLPVCIGAAIAHNGQEDQHSQYFPGIIDEVRVWKTALSQDDLKANMNREPEFFIAVMPLGKLSTSWGMIRE